MMHSSIPCPYNVLKLKPVETHCVPHAHADLRLHWTHICDFVVLFTIGSNGLDIRDWPHTVTRVIVRELTGKIPFAILQKALDPVFSPFTFLYDSIDSGERF